MCTSSLVHRRFQPTLQLLVLMFSCPSWNVKCFTWTCQHVNHVDCLRVHTEASCRKHNTHVWKEEWVQKRAKKSRIGKEKQRMRKKERKRENKGKRKKKWKRDKRNKKGKEREFDRRWLINYIHLSILSLIIIYKNIYTLTYTCENKLDHMMGGHQHLKNLNKVVEH